VGKLAGEKREGGDLVTEWKSDEPLLVAGFNYGEFKEKERIDDVSKTALEAYATTEPPDWLKSASESPIDDLGAGQRGGRGTGGIMLTPFRHGRPRLVTR